VWRFEWAPGGLSSVPADVALRWDQAFEARGNIWQCRHFVRAWETCVAPRRGQTPVLLVANDDAGHEVLYPLVHHSERASLLSRVEVTPIGGAYYCDYQDPLSTGAEMSAGDFADFWSAFDDAFRNGLGRQLGRLSRFRAFRLHLPPSELATNLGRDVAPYIRVTGFRSLDDFLASRSKKFRDNVRRGMRQLQELGCTDLTVLAGGDISGGMEAFLRNYRLQWGSEGRETQLDLPGTGEFWAELAESAARLGKLHLSNITVAGEVWHWHLGFKHRGSVLWYKPTYNPEYARHSPGTLHLAMIVREAIAEGCETVDLGCGAEPYKYRWTEDEAPLFPFESERYGRLLATTRAARGLRSALLPRLAAHS
jgi:CelD/BcsL family acetyltransferase involved in cellulose biosynthesis